MGYFDEILAEDLGSKPAPAAPEKLPGVQSGKRYPKDWFEYITQPDEPDPAMVSPSPDEPSMWTLTKVAAVDDPEIKKNILAKGRNVDPSRYQVVTGKPDQPMKSAKTGMPIKGASDEPVFIYQGDDGNLYAEHVGGLKMLAAEQVASLPSTVLSTIGAVGAGIPGAMAGGAAGEAIQAGIAQALGEEQTTLGVVGKMGLGAAVSAAGAGVGAAGVGGANAAMRRRGGVLARAAGRDVATINQPANQAVEAEARRFGVNLFAPQVTESRNLIGKWKLLADLPDTGDLIQKAGKEQAEQVQGAIANFLETVSPAMSRFDSGGRLVEASKKAVQKPVDIRAAKAAPIYKRAFKKREVTDTDALQSLKRQADSSIDALKAAAKPTADHNAMVAELKGRGVPTMRQTAENDKAFRSRIEQDYTRITKKPAPMTGGQVDQTKLAELTKNKQDIEDALAGKSPAGFITPTKPFTIDVSDALSEVEKLMAKTVPKDPSYAALSRVKDMIKSAGGDLEKLDRVKRTGIDNVLNKTGTSRTMSREMMEVKKRLVDAMDSASPDYATARKIYSSYSEEVEKQAAKTITSGLSKLENDQVVDAARRLFASVSGAPELVSKARRTIYNYDRRAWDAAVRAHIEDITGRAATLSGETNAGGWFAKATIGDPKQRKILAAAMGGENSPQFRNLEAFAEIMRRAGLLYGKESRTDPISVVRRQMEKEGESMVIGAAQRAATPTTWLNIAGDQLEKAQNVYRGKYNRAVAEAMIDPAMGAQLRRIRQIPPKGEKWAMAVTTFLAGIADVYRTTDEIGELP